MDVCRVCSESLTVQLDPDEDQFEGGSSSLGSVPDDLQLICGCHMHWQCLLDESSQIVNKLNCPSCDKSIASSIASSSTSVSGNRVPTRYHNEGGIQEDLDILPLITEEAYLDEHPKARPARAFMTMCAEGDIFGINDLLSAVDDDEDGEGISAKPILRYQDPLDGMKSGLHVAVEKGQEEVIWLLLWLASTLSTNIFPEQITQMAETVGVGRDTADGEDIRNLRDAEGRLASDLARSTGNVLLTELLSANLS
ncbi:faf8eb4a-ee45-4557-9c06-25fcede9c95e [Sclerotinia trifoliorum]|uniref:Faf8eb4a-ee45-4557-9c06-25fcede9c95e n=1 Tax=Sclerotinia trifoliorum TaxID=28548 RepID=A0A8H2ZXG0_9HELO|nr:faf8eb4a-ee45-4557-9c06-25fcede9c95e [Sclerotinia trifoliorum]